MCIRLEDITKENWEYVIGLTTNDNLIPTISEKYVMSNAYSLLESIYKKKWEAKGIVLCNEDNEKMIGFAMYGPTELDGEIVYELCRFMIDVRFQGKGYGTKALSIILEEMKKTYDCNSVYLSIVPENTNALHLYEKVGFVSTGIVVGNELHYENVYRIVFDNS